jgi:DNA-directed RNA polymerase sigma subunit (sigma70/sigma32)
MKKRVQPSNHTSFEEQSVEPLSNELRAMLDALVAEKRLSEQDKRILLLRLGLEGDKCHTLIEVATILDKSPELVRSRQYLALRRNTRDLRFFKLLKEYAHLVKLPRGVTYYLNRYSDGDEHF